VKRTRGVLAGTAVLVAGTVAGIAAVVSGGSDAAPAAQQLQASTVNIQRGNLSDLVSEYGTLTYRAQPDGSPYAVINRSTGTYTALPKNGDKIDCGGVLYRVDDKPVLLLCGTIPAYRDLHSGDTGNDVRQVNRNLHERGYDTASGVAIDPNDTTFTSNTEQAVQALQHDKGLPVTGALALNDAVFLPEAVRIANVTGGVGGAAQPNAPVAQATSDTPQVQVLLDPAQQGAVTAGDLAQITLPGNESLTGTVDRVGTVTDGPVGPDGKPGNATIPVYITLDNPANARGFDQVSVRVEITTAGIQDALSVPVTAIVGKAGGGFAVEVVRQDGRHQLVAVKLGLFDSAEGRVQIEGAVREADHVVVPSL
jgi:peptidoglycan hydrolase-like protein with peptidoglycan-binding domain